MTLIPLISRPIGELNKVHHRRKKIFKKIDKFTNLYIKNKENGEMKHIIKYKNKKIRSINFDNNNLRHGYYKEWNKKGELIIKDFYYRSKLVVEFDITKMKSLKEIALCKYIEKNRDVPNKENDIFNIY